jgi:hypothetical protein
MSVWASARTLVQALGGFGLLSGCGDILGIAPLPGGASSGQGSSDCAEACPPGSACVGGECQPFPTSYFPAHFPETRDCSTDLAFEGSDLLFIAQAPPLFDNRGRIMTPANQLVKRMRHATGSVETVTEELASYLFLHAVAYHAATDTIFVGGTSPEGVAQIVAIDPATGATTVHATHEPEGNAEAIIPSVAVAPETFGSYGGELFFVNGTSVYHVAADVPGTPQLFVHFDGVGNTLSDVAFGVGVMWVVNYDGYRSVDATGVPSPSFVPPFGEGIAVDEAGLRLLVACNQPDCIDDLESVDLTSGTASLIKTFHFADGWFPTGVAYDSVSTVIVSACVDPWFLSLEATSL